MSGIFQFYPKIMRGFYLKKLDMIQYFKKMSLNLQTVDIFVLVKIGFLKNQCNGNFFIHADFEPIMLW
jgi:hypothetical protein